MSAPQAESTVSSRNTPTGSTFASESTDYPDPLLNKLFLAGCRKNFVGQGPSMFSKAEIQDLDIPDLADLVHRKAEHSQVKKSMTYYLGLCRVYQKAVTYFEEDAMKLLNDLNSVLYNKEDVPSKPKKAQKPSKKKDEQKHNSLDAASICSLQLADHDFAALFERKLQTDTHLMVEMDDRIPAPEEDTFSYFGDEPHLPNDFSVDRIEQGQINPSGTSPLVPDDFPENAGTTIVTQAIVHESEGTQAGRASSPRRGDGGDPTGDNRSAKSTPKRKPGSAHDETPSKRHRIKSPPGPSGDKSSVSRKLFGSEAPSSPPHADEIMRQNPDQEGVGPFIELVPPPPASQEGTRRNSVQIGGDDAVPDVEVEQEIEQPPAPVVPSETAQTPPEASLASSNDTTLEELPEEAIAALTPKRRRRPRPLVDQNTQIPRMDISDFGKYVHVHTRTVESTRINLEKLSFKNLLSMPSMKLKANGPCTWSEKLQHLFIENAHPILQPSHERTLPSPTPRDINVDKRPRLSTFGRDARPGSIGPQDQNIALPGIEENLADPDRELMPPPPEPPMLFPPSDEQATPRTPDRSRSQQNRPPSLTSSPHQRSPLTTGRGKQPDISSVQSPRQGPLIPVILEPGSDAAGAGQSDEAALPFISAQMSPTPSARERSTLMSERAFYKFLEDKWVSSFVHRVELDDLIDPRRSTLTKFHRYFTYLQSYQVKKKLTMEQDTIYGPVHILKTIVEQEE